MKVFDALSKREVHKEEISTDIEGLRKLSLVDDLGLAVVPVMHPTDPHFRRLSGDGTRLGGEETRDIHSHNECRSYLKESLGNASGFRLVTNVFDAKTEGAAATSGATRSVLLDATGDRPYEWFEEGHARIGVSPEKYIQPDVAGRRAERFAARPSSPSIILEIVRTHTPEPATMVELLKLSSMGYFVLFYFIPTKKEPIRGRDERYNCSKYNHVAAFQDGSLDVRVTYYLYAGECYKGGVVYKPFANKTVEDYAEFVGGVLAKAANRVGKEK